VIAVDDFPHTAAEIGRLIDDQEVIAEGTYAQVYDHGPDEVLKIVDSPYFTSDQVFTGRAGLDHVDMPSQRQSSRPNESCRTMSSQQSCSRNGRTPWGRGDISGRHVTWLFRAHQYPP